ncbi:MAG TPA: Flp pilus assembly protein CpaB [Baekduia sp.]
MTRRRRAALLLGLALLLGTLAASDVAGREAALQRSVGPAVPVVVVRTRLAAGARLDAEHLAVRHVPARFAPASAYASVAALAGTRAAVALEPGQDVAPAVVDDGTRAAGAPVRPGERVADLVAQGSAELVRPGGRVDVLVTREAGDGGGSTSVALEDAEVLAAHPAPAGDQGDDGPRVAVSLRVTVRQAVFLAAAQSFARELRLLPRAAGDRRHGLAGTTVGADLR